MKKNSLTFFFTLAFLLLQIAATAQTDTRLVASETGLKEEIIIVPAKEVKGEKHDWSFGSINGLKTIKSLFIYDLGLNLTRSLGEGQRVSLESSYRFSDPKLAQSWGRRPMNMKAEIATFVVGASYEWFPFVLGKRGSSDFFQSLKVIGGFWYVHNPVYFFDTSLAESVQWDTLTFSIEEVGSVFTTITTNKVQPFLGVGYDPFYLYKKISFSLKGGALYQGQPKVAMTASNMLAPTAGQASKFQSNLSDYQIIPFAQMSLQINL
jgi:hypothetical protein